MQLENLNNAIFIPLKITQFLFLYMVHIRFISIESANKFLTYFSLFCSFLPTEKKNVVHQFNQK